MPDIARATQPGGNFVVHAAAGTGKTWLLTSRIIHLLLKGAQPGAILAITFTRKAAAEIEQRVMERLLEMAASQEEALIEKLAEIGCAPSPAILKVAGQLYESLLVSEHPLRVTTFHAFCQSLLQRFPLESGLPPGFQVVENPQQLQDLAWQKFENKLRNPAQKDCLASFNVLLQLMSSPVTVRNALYDFLRYRTDWLAYVEGKTDAIAYAQDGVERLLAGEPAQVSFDTTARETLRKKIRRYGELLAKHPTKPNQKQIALIENNSLETLAEFLSLNKAGKVFRDSNDKARVFSDNNTTRKSLGVEGISEIHQLEVDIQHHLDQLGEQEKRNRNKKINYAWFRCGQAFLEEYQQLKIQLAVLDFADLEWQAYRLLNQSEFAHWVQYKLDQRIDHLLVDEFQDTNPTQWHLLLPLLDEMAAGQTERDRSAFIVGDIKQSIYRFRRAAPGLFHHATQWLTINMRAETASQKKSYRSSPAVMEFVNLLFDRTMDSESSADTRSGDHYQLHDFTTHHAHHQQRWGKVEILPLIQREKPGAKEEKGSGFRNPLTSPRRHRENITEKQHRLEIELIVGRINALIGLTIDDDTQSRPLHYGDIMILVRSRAHTAIYETELRRAGIPFTSASKDQFLSALEIKDISHLLRALLSPHDNLALASVLRSPIFSCSNQTLISLARQTQPWWWQRLQQVAAVADDHDPVHRAWHLLIKWRELVDKIPVHDLLDKIFEQANIVNRYLAGAPDHVRPRIETNLNHLLELALQMDSGRYPSLSQFVASLPYLGGDENAPAADTGSDRRVRIMTIHGAKGLEAPVVFLADAARTIKDHAASYRTIISWPDNARKPEFFLLAGKMAERDAASDRAYEAKRQADKHEEANLLYVALTRARQILFISGCEPGSKDHGWYGFIRSRLEQERKTLMQGMADFDIQLRTKNNDDTSPLVISYGHPGDSHVTASTKPVLKPGADIDDALTRPIKSLAMDTIVNPSLQEELEDDVRRANGDAAAARKRGIWIHRILECLTNHSDTTTIRIKLKLESQYELENDEFERYWELCLQLVTDADLCHLLRPDGKTWSRNEMPVLFRQDGIAVFGIVDRVVVKGDQVTVIDYKTHETASKNNIAMLAEPYTTQMRYYGDGVSKLWPDKNIKLLLLFTACAETVEVPYPAGN
ncbi:MAG: UvrD-helicase domain-containing protein [Acidiferrobacterales bacterium]